MKTGFLGWSSVADRLRQQAREQDNKAEQAARLNRGQRASLRAIADRIERNGVVIADEVGMGKTRIAVEVVRAVTECGGRAVVLVPPGLGYQWQDELDDGGVRSRDLLRSLQQYFVAWADNNEPWFESKVVLLSHAFTNWRLSGASAVWRWALVPELFAQMRKLGETSRVPNGYHEWRQEPKEELLKYELVTRAAVSIAEAVTTRKIRAVQEKVQELSDLEWKRTCEAEEYIRQGDSQMRNMLEKVIGMGLGTFDLVVIDEAHKSRGEESGLSNLIKHVVTAAPSARKLAITATPVELELGQWEQTLRRIGIDDEQWTKIKLAIDLYDRAVQDVRIHWRDNEQVRQNYISAAREFEAALAPYLLRRDKREDATVQRFKDFGIPFQDYRQESPIEVNHADLSQQWKQAICAAESLSVLASASSHDERSLQRLRLTIGNGHGIAAVINPGNDDSDEENAVDENAIPCGATSDNNKLVVEDIDPIAFKRHARIDFWTEVIRQSFEGTEQPLYDHPAIVHAVKEIEHQAARGEKVLVFGRFVAPLKALVEILNAREMIRRITSEEGQWWPEKEIGGQSLAVKAALRQMELALSLEDIRELLEAQYNRRRYQMGRFRETLLDKLEAGLSGLQHNYEELIAFDALKRRLDSSPDEVPAIIELIARPLMELLDEDYENVGPHEVARSFRQLIAAITERGEADENQDGEITLKEADRFWALIEERLGDEFNTQRGAFARLLVGGMKPRTKRMLQLGFNRSKGFPRVLVAQSIVGREGLNLHRACRIVVLLHPEWNPGVVEQQIGRVDRVGSLWCKEISSITDDVIAPDLVPRIEIKPVIFKCTYDEQNWKVLRKRWDSLRAQLHGIVISGGYASTEPKLQEIARRITDAAPNFSPTKSQDYSSSPTS
jgi:hypothetical protein